LVLTAPPAYDFASDDLGKIEALRKLLANMLEALSGFRRHSPHPETATAADSETVSDLLRRLNASDEESDVE
jgi:hypothetical protein